MARSDLPPASALVIQTWFRAITGEENPWPGTAVFQATFFVSFQ
jgi:hypothetical protein